MTCKICRSACREFFDTQFNVRVFYCKRCFFLFKDPEISVSKADAERKYLQHNNRFDSVGYVSMLNDLIDSGIAPYMISGTGRSALDYGCGPGPDWVLSELLKRRGFKVNRYDPLFCPDFPETPTRFDLITLTEVIEHTADPLELFGRLSKLLKPEAVLLLTTLFHPVVDDTQEAFAPFLQWWYRRDFTHITFFRPETIVYAAEQYGLVPLLIKAPNLCVLKKK